MRKRTFALIWLAVGIGNAEVQAQQLRAAPPSDPLKAVIKDLVLDMNPAADKCYNIVNGMKVEVKCPDVIVAKPDANSRQDSDIISGLVSKRAMVSRTTVRQLAAELPIDEGTYNCYNEDSPGHFVRVNCPDIIVLTTN